MSEASELGSKMAELTSKYGTKGVIAATAIIGGGAVIDWAMGWQDQRRAERQQRIQEHQLMEKNKSDIKYRHTGIENAASHEGLVQAMFNSSIGHSNSWGGKKY